MSGDRKHDYLEVSLPITPDYLEGVCNYIIENICGGLVLEDEEGGEETILRFYLAHDIDSSKMLSGLDRYLISLDLGRYRNRIKKRSIKDIDWLESYQLSIPPILIGKTIVIKTPWHNEQFPGRTEIILEPKMAFGTGHHETTRSCLAVMEEVSFTDKRVLDLGCGSGLLGIYAALRGASFVIGYDTDPLAIADCQKNFPVNDVENICHAELGTIDDIAYDTKFDILAVNIIKETILPIIGRLKGMASDNGVIILSGLLEKDSAEIEEAFEANRLVDYYKHFDNEWVTYRINAR